MLILEFEEHRTNEEGKEIFERCNKIQTKEFILIAISNLDWNNDMLSLIHI